MKSVAIALCLAASAALAFPAAARGPAAVTERTEKVKLKGKKGESLFKPGFVLGEYEGWSTAKSSSSSVTGIFEGNKASAEIQVAAPGLGPLTILCGGGQSRLGLGWITFDRDKLTYVCTVTGQGAGVDASFALAQSKGKLLAQLQQPQRAGELRFGGRTYRVQTKQVGGMPIGGGTPLGYVISRDGEDVGAVDLVGLGPTAYLPAAGSADRNGVAVAALILIFFKDQGKLSR
jgi:hypothetical protein